MSLDQFITLWPVILWATVLIFMVGGAWVTLIMISRDMKEMKTKVEKIAVLEGQVNTSVGEINRLRDDMQEVGIKAEKALLLQGGMNLHAGD